MHALEGMKLVYGKCPKISNTFLILFSNETIVFCAGIYKNTGQNSNQGRPGPDCFFQKQSDLGLPCLSGLFQQATSVQNFRTFTVHYNQQEQCFIYILILFLLVATCCLLITFANCLDPVQARQTKPFDTLMVSLKVFFENLNCGKNHQATKKKHAKLS